MKRFLIAFALLGFAFAGSASAQPCEAVDTSRFFEDTDCDGVKDAGEEYYGLASGAPGTDSINTTELNDGADTPLVGQIVATDSATATLFEYLVIGGGLSTDGDTLTVDHDAATNFVADEHVAHGGVTFSAGLGLAGGGTIAASRSYTIDYSQTLAGDPAFNAEECWFSSEGAGSGGIVCEGTAANTNEQLYLLPASDGVDTTNWLALADSAGAALRWTNSVIQSGGDFSTADDAVRKSYVARIQTTDATPSELFLNGTTTRMTLASDSSMSFECLVVARRADVDSETATYKFTGGIDNNAGTTALTGGVQTFIVNEDTTTWSMAATADDTNDALIFTATGVAASTINWVVSCDTTQVTG